MPTYTSPLTESEVRHLLRRATFGAKASEIATYKGKTAQFVVDDLLNGVTTVPLPKKPFWSDILPPDRNATAAERAEFSTNNTTWRNELVESWILQMAKNRMRDRLSLFWHDHFVTSYLEYTYSARAYRYLTTLRKNAIGNFKDFVHAIGIDPAMLLYLDGYINNGNAPNENYARELLELFTMGHQDQFGVDNYTESDIQEIAKALSGWIVQIPQTWDVAFVGTRFDDGEKTFFGRTGEYGYDDVIDIIFEERSPQIAHFIAEKLVVEFVYREPDAALVAEVAASLLSSNFNIGSALRVLFTSTTFFDPVYQGGRHKSPIEMCVGLVVEADLPLEEQLGYDIRRAIPGIEQTLLDPPNVAGWPGHRNWITTNTLSSRWTITEAILRTHASDADLLALGEALTPPGTYYASLDLALAIAQHVFAVPMEWLEVAEIEEPFEGDLATLPLPDWFLNGPAYHRNLVKIFLNGLPWYEWNLSIGGAPDRLRAYLVRLTQFPEYQLS